MNLEENIQRIKQMMGLITENIDDVLDKMSRGRDALDRLQELFAWIESFTNLERSGAVFSARAYQLERMRVLARRLGDPQSAFRCLHVAGSKGKGSTSALLAWSLQAAGLRTGLYTSPHVEIYVERWCVLEDGPADPRPELLEELGGQLRGHIASLPPEFLREYGQPTTFELLTLVAPVAIPVFSPDGAVLAAGTGDGRALLWDSQTGELLHSLAGHADLTVPAFSPDGSRLATTSWDGDCAPAAAAQTRPEPA